ncbi:FAD-binding oxidoreductase [Mumia sp. zg.B53]|uniref:FAD-binding oxidoreductase n=1 Tax=Mumia sp. zg.B53 TaxID=2855449 RepID=UPI001C6F41EE|nr:FAD-binding oxidoreductase [Mumia sp. zg.B53]MBW9216697.1 FAD-binding oxidoreductase [Mumia sp. zg.B53]
MSTPPARRTSLSGWGRTSATVGELRVPLTVDEVRRGVLDSGPRGVAVRGLGRSYGDAAQNAGGTVLDLTALDGFVAIDEDTPSVTVQAGVSLDTLMKVLLPRGLWLPVLPGTRQVTVGGAVAADVHGKNHHRDGSFGRHVSALELLTADGTVRRLTPDGDESPLFWATVGGMGLTGVVLSATIALTRTSSSYFLVDTERTRDIDDLIAVLSDGDQRYPYSVAWFDTTLTGRGLGRGVVTRGRAATPADLGPRYANDALRFDAPSLGTVPSLVPSGLVNSATARAFNTAWYHRAPRHREQEVQNITQFFHPLDVISDWNRLYGARGFVQYQFVVPFGAEETLRSIVVDIARSPYVSCLNVLKRFGPGDPAPMSFPIEGWTLAVDLPVAPGLGAFLDRFDTRVAEAGGRLYLAKDSRAAPSTIAAMYPRLDEFRRIRADVDPDNRFCTDLARRLAL